MAPVDGFDTIERTVAAAVPDPLATVRASEIGPLFGAGPFWFGKAKVRERLYAEGFPRPIRPSTYLKRAVVRFIVCRSQGIDPRGAGAPVDASMSTSSVEEAMRRAAERRRRARHAKHRRRPQR